MKIKFLIAFFMSALSLNVLALGPFHLDFHGGFGKGAARFENAEKSKPVTYQYGAGATLGYKFGMLLYAGASFDYYKMIQTTDANSTWGNRKGTRMNLLSPTLGFRVAGLHLKLDYQFMGKYTLDKKDSGGSEVFYESPKGYRAYLGYRFFVLNELGIFYEKVTYEKETIGSNESKLSDGNLMEVSQIGLMFTIPF